MNANLLSRLFIAWLTCLAALLFAPILLAAEAEKAPPVATEDNTLSIHIDDMLQPWKGDLPGMTERRTIRVLTTYSKTFFFIDKGTQRGATHDIFMALENDLNKQLAKDKKLKQRHLKLHIVFVPVSRDNLFIALNEGKGDIAAANLTITPSREAQSISPSRSTARERITDLRAGIAEDRQLGAALRPNRLCSPLLQLLRESAGAECPICQ